MKTTNEKQSSNQKIKKDNNKIAEKQIKKDKILVQKNNAVIKETKRGDTKITEYDDGTIIEETGLETRSLTDDETVTKYQNGTVSTWTRVHQRTVTIHPDGTIVRSEYADSGVFGTTTRYTNGTSIRVTDVSTGFTYRHGDIGSKTIYRDGTVIIYPRGGDTFRITEFPNGTKITESNTGKLTKTVIGVTSSNKKLTTSGNEIKISKDDVKKIYKIAKLHEATATSLSGVNDQQKIILQKSTASANKAITKEQKDKLKPLLKGQDSDKKDIKAIQDYAKKVSNAIKKLAQKQGIKQSELDKITKIPKDGKPTKTGPINQLKQDAADAKEKLKQARDHQEGLIIDAMYLSNILGETDLIRDAMTEMIVEDGMMSVNDARILLANSRDKLTPKEIQNLERIVRTSDERAEREEIEKSKQHVIDMMQQLLELVQKDEQAQTDSILNTIPDATLQDLFGVSKPVAKTDPSKPVINTNTSQKIKLQSKNISSIPPSNPCVDVRSTVLATWVIDRSSGVNAGKARITIADAKEEIENEFYIPEFHEVNVQDGVVQLSAKVRPGTYSVSLNNVDGKIVENSRLSITIPNLCTTSPPPAILVEPGTGTNPPPKTNTKPTLTIPKQITQEATSSAGAAINYPASGQDKEDGAIIPSCSHPSGYTFPIGATTVSCTADDLDGNSISGTFTVTIRDTTPPNIAAFQPSEGIRDESGVQVFYEVTATDLVDGVVQVSCNYPSGYKFPIGTTVLTCTSVDSRGNQSSRSLQITVTSTQSGQ